MLSLILVSGEEDFLAERAANLEAKASLSGSVSHYRFPSEQSRYRTEALRPDVSSNDKSCFVVWGADSVPDLPDYECTVVVVSKKQLSHPRATRSHHFPKLKSFFDNNEILGWIIKEGERLTIDLSRVATGLFVNSGNCLRKLASEIDKLAALTPPGGIVSPDDARGVLCFSAELSPREIVDSICDGQTLKALALYDKLQEQGDETGWILAYMHRHVLSQLRSDLMLARGVPSDRAAGVVGVHPYVYRKGLAARRGLWTEQSLRQSVGALGRMDVLHKRGKDVAWALEFEIVRLSEEAKCRPAQ